MLKRKMNRIKKVNQTDRAFSIILLNIKSSFCCLALKTLQLSSPADRYLCKLLYAADARLVHHFTTPVPRPAAIKHLQSVSH